MIKVYGVHGSPFVEKSYLPRDEGLDYEMVAQMPLLATRTTSRSTLLEKSRLSPMVI